jgi:hypothetical protein
MTFAAQVTVIGQARVCKFIAGGDAVLFQHEHQHFCLDELAGEEWLHAFNQELG